MPRYECLIPVEKRILIHLLSCINSKNKSEAPITLTQDGIAQAVSASRGYIPRPLKELITKGYIVESIGRVKGGKKKQRYYMLTSEGRAYTQELKKELSDLQITLRQLNGTLKKMLFKDIIPYLAKNKIYPAITELDVCINISKDSVLDIDSLKTIKKTQFVDFSAEAPRVLHFFGRKKEMNILEKWVEDKKGHSIIFIHGIAGIGKTTLAAKLIEGYRQSKHLFWHNFHNLDTLRGVLFKLSEFLSKLGHDHLEMYIRTRTSLDYYEVSRIIGKSIGNINAILVFDDFHKSEYQIREFFVYFLRMLSSPSNIKMIILSREIVPFYDRRDVLSREIVAELELEGLDFKSSKRLLKGKGIDKRKFKEIYGFTAGNPLFLEIFESRDNLERYVHDELFLKLEEDERKILGAISIHRFPVPEDSLVMNKDFHFEKLYALTQKSIVKKDSRNLYFVHDIIKQFFYTRLSPTERRMHHSLAAKWYENRDEPIDLIEAIYHHIERGDHEMAAQFAIDSSTSILDSGYASEFLTILERFDEKNLETNVWAEILRFKGKASNMCGEWEKALLYFNDSADIASIIGDKKLEVKAICEIGHILEEQNQFDRAMDCFNKCLDISKEFDHTLGIGRGYQGIGRIYWRKEEREEAILNFEKCIEISKNSDNKELIASVYIDLGNVYDEKYETEKAIECYNKSLYILKKCKNTYETARAYGNLAITYRHIDEFKRAIKYHEKQLELAQNLKDMKVKGYGYAGISYCFAKVNEFEKALKYAEKAEDIALKIDNENIMNITNRAYSLICKYEGRLTEGTDYLEKSLEYLDKLKASYQLPDSHFELGLLYEEAGDIKNAKKHFKIASNLYNKLDLGKTKFVRDKLSKYKKFI